MKALALAFGVLAGLLAADPSIAEGKAGADRALVDEGRYLATAGDCAGCHGPGFAGGHAVDTPVGAVTASNITPDDATGIGRWSLAQFSDALRKGKAPGGHLYPAMPYTAYAGLDDRQVQALYAYFHLGVPPVAHSVAKTELPFPFERPVMSLWNAMFLRQGHAPGAQPAQGAPAERGRLLVETLGHCSDCHSPRGELMQQVSSKHLGGAMVGGWWAPNLTPGKGGLADWRDAELATFLATGHTPRATAAGEMATVVSRSLSKLRPDDISAIVAYLRQVPAVDAPVPSRGPTAPVDAAAVEPDGAASGAALLAHDGTDGGVLYQSACATCHGFAGDGTKGAVHPSLRVVDAAAAPEAANLVQVIVHGVDRAVGDHTALMPGFGGDMSSAQVAALANYVRTTFGGVSSSLTAADVERIRNARIGRPWLIRNARWLAIAGIAIPLVILFWLIALVLRGRRPA